MGLTKAHNRMIEGAEFSVSDFGAVGNGTTDDSAAIQAAVDAAKAVNGTVVFDAKTYYVASGIDLRSSTGVNLRGAGRQGTVITTDNDIVVFTVFQYVTIQDLRIMQTGTAGTGKAIATTSTTQAFFCTFERLTIDDFKFGFLFRYSLWVAFRDLRIDGCTCGIRMARNNDWENQTNPDAAAGWNISGGWFHNQISVDNVLIQGGEVGVWASCMGTTFNNLTCQQQDTDGATNSVLPSGQVGTGVWVEGGTAAGTGGGRGFNVVFVNYYTEVTRKSLKVNDLREVSVLGWFAQGNTSGSPYDEVLEADNVNVYVRNSTGQDYWTNTVVLTGGANVYGAVRGIGGVASVASGCGYFPNNNDPQAYFRNFGYDNTGSGVSATVPVPLGAKGVYRVSVAGFYNGITEIHCLYQVSRWSIPPTDNLQLVFGTETGFTTSLDASSQLVISQTGALRLQLSIFVEEISEFAGDLSVNLPAS